MTEAISRRSLIAGLGAAIVVAAFPVAALPVASKAPFEFSLPVIGGLTVESFTLCLRFLAKQVADLGPLCGGDWPLVIEAVDTALDRIRPSCFLIDVRATVKNIAAGEFYWYEAGPGHVIICDVGTNHLEHLKLGRAVNV